jgi:PAS domain S-box-containing protein
VPISIVFFVVGIIISYLSSNLRKKTEEANKEVAIRKQKEAELITYRENLEHLVKQRTVELEKANLDLNNEIVEHKKTEQELQKAQEGLEARIQERTRELGKVNRALDIEMQRFNDVLESLPVYVILLAPDYHVPFANRFFRERFGESHGKRCYEYLFNRTEPCENCETYKVLKTHNPHHWEWTGPDRHNYDIFDFPFADVDGTPLIMEVGIDITEQKRAQDALLKAHAELEVRVQERTRELKETNKLLQVEITERKEAEEREKQAAQEWQTTFDSIADMVSIQDKNFRLVRVNKAYANAVGMRQEELNGKTCYAVIHGAACPIENCPHLETLKTQKTATREIFEPRLGTYCEVMISPIFNKDGEFSGSVHIIRDITERKKAEQMKDEFISLVSHELRTPMTVITGSLRTAMTEGISREDKDILLQNAIDGAGSLSAILENLLELSRYQAGRLQLHKEPVNIPEIAHDVIESLKAQAEGHSFLTDFHDKLPLVDADPMRVERILYNLLENAVKYSPEGSEIKVFTRKEKQTVVTGVADKGIGISHEDQGRIF